MSGKVQAEHGVVCRLAGETFGYFGWPSIARTDGGRLVVASSGLRTRHVCPFGKTALNVSDDDGRTWSAPQVIHDSPLDNRDAGVVGLGGEALLVSFFTSDTREYFEGARKSLTDEEAARWEQTFGGWTDRVVSRWRGSWVMTSADGAEWGQPIRVPVSSPHGPIRLAGGELLYLGKASIDGDQRSGPILACRSSDAGRSWEQLGRVPLAPHTRPLNYYEPHVAELADGRLAAMIRFELRGQDDPAGEQISFSLFQTTSDDGGYTWTQARPTGVYGSPPHLLRHSTGTLICVYGYRRPPYGQRAMISRDGGQSWQADLILRDDGPGWDLGYPASVEMPDSSILTVYYQQYRAGERCSLLWTRWTLP